jgi:UDP-N-acetylmuramate dehydrogenase
MFADSLLSDLHCICPGGVTQDVSLAEFSRWKIGGLADVVVEPDSVHQLSSLRQYLDSRALVSLVIGDTSNLLFADEGCRAVCIRLARRLSGLSIHGCRVSAEAGIWVPSLARKSMLAGLTGVEHICGIPGTLGGLVCMNGGSQRQGIGQSVLSVTAVSPDGSIEKFSADDCLFDYRQSVFQSNHHVIALVELQLSVGESVKTVRQSMLSLLRARSQKFPRKMPNCGSVFKSDPSSYQQFGPPGSVLEALQLKGTRFGDAAISEAHANFFVNLGNSSARDMLALIHFSHKATKESLGYHLQPEVRFVRESGEIVCPLEV